MSSLLALTMRMGISSCSRSLRQIVFVSVDVNGIFSFGEENKILLWGQEGNQPPAGEIFRMFQIAVKKDMAGNFGGTRALGYIFQIQIIIAAAQGWGAGRHNGGDDFQSGIFIFFLPGVLYRHKKGCRPNRFA